MSTTPNPSSFPLNSMMDTNYGSTDGDEHEETVDLDAGSPKSGQETDLLLEVRAQGLTFLGRRRCDRLRVSAGSIHRLSCCLLSMSRHTKSTVRFLLRYLWLFSLKMLLGRYKKQWKKLEKNRSFWSIAKNQRLYKEPLEDGYLMSSQVTFGVPCTIFQYVEHDIKNVKRHWK